MSDEQQHDREVDETELGGLVPPYDRRSTERGSSESSQALTESVGDQLEGVEGGNAGQTASPVDERPASSDALGGPDPESPHNVGESTSRRGEDIADKDGKEPGRQDAGVEDTPAQRPVGTSTPRDMTGINPED